MNKTISLEEALEVWFHRLGSDDPKWWAKELVSYLTLPDDNGFVWVSEGMVEL